MTRAVAPPLTPTREQQAALDLFTLGGPLVIEAGAGTGKTSTLELLARSTARTGAYIAFNKSIAEEAAVRFPNTTACSTIHSLAYQVLKHRLRIRDRLDESKRIPSSKLARRLGIGPQMVTITEPTVRTKVLQPAFLAGHVMRALRKFCESKDAVPDTKHFPYLDGIDGHTPDGRRARTNNQIVALHLLSPLEKAWDDVQNPHGPARFIHDHYLKIWQLGQPEVPGEYVLFDEAQDANGVMLGILDAQVGKQLVYVGDSQQQIYEWRGAINALGIVEGERAWLTQSFRFGQRIADVANSILMELDSPLRLTGTGIPSRVEAVAEPRTVLCRSNATAINVLLSQQRLGRAAHLVGGGREILDFAVAAGRLQAGEHVTHPELVCFDSWREVLAYVEDDPQGDELRMLVHLVEEYGVQIIIDAVDGHVAEAEADVIISTAHKAKGREWETVRLAPDFDPPTDKDGDRVRELQAPEWRLLYVACTRAQQTLDVTRCQAVTELLEPAT